ncbi:MAG: ABC transporter ATP-binding protein [Candidatus Methanomethylophilaceae archaeon]|nr:ABC transporter ATP-binding protein [Candidatus Methanomethylophilaceae archaeon]MDD3986276.1 ABC transporter ATP-binding protein [Candidatus Methanomethylophilaceae archaeon]MDD4709345.1 ABC transporter ATP-binding protein [Candidatus Methanomethylophilaceae archaeon]
MSGRRGPADHPGMTAEKPKAFTEAWKKIFSYMGKYRIAVWISIVFAVVGTVMILVGPNKLRDLTDLIAGGLVTGSIDMGAIWEIGLFLIAIYAASTVLTFVQNYILATVSQKMASKFRTDISKKINRLPLRYFDTSSSGDVLSRATNDVDTLGQSMNQSIGLLITSVTMLLGSLVMMVYTNYIMAAVTVLSCVAGFGMMILIMRYSQKYFGIQQENLGNMNGHVAEIYSAHNVVKVYNGQKEASKKFDSINEELARSAFMSQFLSGLMMPLMNFIGNFGYVTVCVVGAAMVINGQISIGVIVAFMIYVRLFTQPLAQMAQAFTGMQSVAAAGERVFEFIEEEELSEEVVSPRKLEKVEGHVEFRNVHFSYVPGREVIHGFSAEIKPGQKIAIVGPTGAGKTTMVNLLMRFYDTDSGDILIDGVSIKEMRRSDVHDLFCMVLQDTWIFEGTVKENIIYCKEGVTDEQVVEACKAVGIHHFIKTLPKGYDTMLDNTTSLSVGQRQQITIARAIVENAPLLILDEATSSVDTRTERAIQNAMDQMTVGRTSFVIAHRLSTIKNSDLILLMRGGNIVEQGTHDELLAAGAFYSEMYNSQFEDGGED